MNHLNTSMDLRSEIKEFFKGDVEDDAHARGESSHDASIFEVRPSLIVHPKDVDDVKGLVRYLSGKTGSGMSVTARSAGTDMSGGTLTESVVMEFTRYFGHLKEIGDGYAITEPGVYYRDFEKETLSRGWLLPTYPASREICTVGGMAANNSGGEKSLRYGKTEDFVRRLKVVLCDGKEHVLEPLSKEQLDGKMAQATFEGELYRRVFRLVADNRDLIMKAKPDVSKNSAGYYLWNVWDGRTFDLTRLFVGSQGTLGLITEITFRLIRPASHSKLVAIFLKDMEPLPALVETVLRHRPESFESYDDYTLKFAMRYSRDIMAAMGAKSAFSLFRRFLPEIGMILTRGFPKLVMLAEFTGMTEEEVDAKIAAAMKDLARFRLPVRVTRTEEEAKKYWVIRRESFNLLRKHFKKKKAAPFVDDLCVKPAVLSEFLPKLYAVLGGYGLTLTVVGHVGDGNFHIIPLMDLSRPGAKDVIREISSRVYSLVFQYGGTTTGEHNDGLVRSPYLREMYGDEVYGLFEEVKRIFDPDGIFNPGKKVGSDLEYALAHLKKD
ncbi:MAG TPA: FAD-binding oxidoreductase [Candidatus Binatia bacterium]|jgi:FAD/FMN-containing dehydrogenase|nr:FAD-binding oxidoreductase [Candidatus Binatia bacterium]